MTNGEEGEGVSRPGAPRITVLFDRPERSYAPHDVMTVRHEVDGVAAASVVAFERSVVWYTEGKGEEDLGVHQFERIEGEGGTSGSIPTGGMSLRLPGSPLSYEGIIVKIRWCVRVRLFFEGGRDFVSEHVFELGAVPPARGAVERLA